MSLDTPSDTLRRKIVARAPASALESDTNVTVARAWQLALVHGFAQSVGLPVSVKEQTVAPQQAAEFCSLMEEGDLAILLEGPGGFGVAILDAQVLAVLIEMQTMGRILNREAAPRTPTATDAGLVATTLDRVLHQFENHASELPESQVMHGMRYATQLRDGRAIALALPDDVHVMTDLRLSLGGEQRKGRLRMLMPRAVPKPDEPVLSSHMWSENLRNGVMDCRVTLTAVLWRVHMPMDEVSALKIGDDITIPSRAITDVHLNASTGEQLAHGRLGKINGNKAIGLKLDDLPAWATTELSLPPKE